MSEPIFYGTVYQEGKFVTGAGQDGKVIVPQVSEMQPAGHWKSIYGVLQPSNSHPSALKRWFMKWLFELEWHPYDRQ